jgi:hypothetical protein
VLYSTTHIRTHAIGSALSSRALLTAWAHSLPDCPGTTDRMHTFCCRVLQLQSRVLSQGLCVLHGCIWWCLSVCCVLWLQAASRSLAVMCDTVWPPNSGKDAWLRGSLAKWLLQAGFEGNNGEVLRQVRTHAQVKLGACTSQARVIIPVCRHG